jgi:hypothetical protein
MRATATRWPGTSALLVMLVLLTAAAPVTGEEVDRSAPDLLVTLEWIPRGYKRLLVVPPGGFRITVSFDAGDGTPIDRSSLTITSDLEMAGIPAGQDLSPLFRLTDDTAVWHLPADAELARTSHWIRVRLRDEAGNKASANLRFAVRDFAFGAPLATLQPIYLDFTRDRHPAEGDDFEMSLRRLGLSSDAAQLMGARLREQIEEEIVARVRSIFGMHPDGSRTPESVNVAFTRLAPEVPHARICIGGAHPRSPEILGSVPLDLDNLDELRDDCKRPDQGVFPDAIAALWRDTGLFRRTFDPLIPAAGGTPVGAHSLDAEVLAKDFSLSAAGRTARRRFVVLMEAFDIFVQAVAVAAAHEVGHMLGLTAPGPVPRGHFGGTHGNLANHNVTPDGNAAQGNFVMNRGGSFSLASIAGREGHPLPRFRALSWAYLHNRIVRNERVSMLRPPPALTHVLVTTTRSANEEVLLLELRGRGFSKMSSVELIARRDGYVQALPDSERRDARTMLARIPTKLIQPGLYDVLVIGGDDQNARLLDPIRLPPAD